MEIKILYSIMFNELMPWSLNVNNLKSINEKLRKANFKDPANDLELFEQVSYLVSDYPDLLKWLSKQKPNSETLLHPHLFLSELPDFTDTSSKYYSILISKEKQRLYNYFIAHLSKFTNKTDIIFNTNQALKNIKALVKSIVKDIEDRGFEDIPTNASSLTHFVLHYLKLELIGLFFDIQKTNEIHLPSSISLEDFYLTELNLPKSSIIQLFEIEPETTQMPKKSAAAIQKLKFGFSGSKEILKNVISELCRNIELLDESKTSQEQLFQVLTAKDLKAKLPQIYINCETVQFSYIVGKLKGKGFQNFNPTSIDESTLFTSINGNIFKKQNLYSNNKETPKNQATIDMIINQLK